MNIVYAGPRSLPRRSRCFTEEDRFSKGPRWITSTTRAKAPPNPAHPAAKPCGKLFEACTTAASDEYPTKNLERPLRPGGGLSYLVAGAARRLPDGLIVESKQNHSSFAPRRIAKARKRMVGSVPSRVGDRIYRSQRAMRWPCAPEGGKRHGL